MKKTIRKAVRYFQRNRYEKLLDTIIYKFLIQIIGKSKPKFEVISTVRRHLNYVSIDLSKNSNWKGDPKDLVNQLRELIITFFDQSYAPILLRGKLNNISFNLNYGTKTDYNENVQIFTGSSNINKYKKPSKVLFYQRVYSSIWFWPTLISLIIIIALIIASIYHFYWADKIELQKIEAINQNITFVTGIFGSFIMTFLMTRVLNLRQEKLKRASQIKLLSEKLAQFQKICYHLINDHRFWNNSEDYKYAKKISDRISYWDSKNLTSSEDDVQFNYYLSLMGDPNHRYDITWLYLQLNMFADLNPLQNLNLLYSKHPPVKIYSLNEIYDFLDFIEYNEIYNYLDRTKDTPEFNSHSICGTSIVEAAKRFDPAKFANATYSKELLIDVSDDVQNHVLPNLYYLLKLNEDRLPISVRYYFYSVVSIIFLTVIWPIIYKLFFNEQLLLNIGSIILLGVFVHILLMFRIFLKSEASLRLPDDYR